MTAKILLVALFLLAPTGSGAWQPLATATRVSKVRAVAFQTQIPPLYPGPPSPEQEQRARLERDMAKKANEERQAALKRDTYKLLKLSQELKDSVDKSSSNTLSMDVMRKAEEIEKLAHSVREKMKGN